MGFTNLIAVHTVHARLKIFKHAVTDGILSSVEPVIPKATVQRYSAASRYSEIHVFDLINNVHLFFLGT